MQGFENASVESTSELIEYKHKKLRCCQKTNKQTNPSCWESRNTRGLCIDWIYLKWKTEVHKECKEILFKVVEARNVIPLWQAYQ